MMNGQKAEKKQRGKEREGVMWRRVGRGGERRAAKVHSIPR